MTQQIRLQQSMVYRPSFFFSTQPEQAEEIIMENKPKISGTERKEFKAETRKLLDIVAKNIYTDKEVFVRELLSNSSDALEKQRYAELTGAGQGQEGEHYIEIETNEKERTLTIFDTGIGMDRENIAANLGTIAKSGSKEFRDLFEGDATSFDDTASDIIGQFGVGFYSSFIVSNHVEVYSKTGAKHQEGVRWLSDGSGEFELSTVHNLDFDRGTKIVIRLNKDALQFCKESEIEKII